MFKLFRRKKEERKQEIEKNKVMVVLYIFFVDGESTWFKHEYQGGSLYAEFKGFLNWYLNRIHSERYLMYHTRGFKEIRRKEIKKIHVELEE